MAIRRDGLTLRAKAQIAEVVIIDAFNSFQRPAVVWSGGKDSTVVLHMALGVAAKLGKPKPPVVFIDHGQHFEETYSFVREVSEAWGLNLIYARNEDVLSKVREGWIRVEELDQENREEARRINPQVEEVEFQRALETDLGNHLLKTVALNRAIRDFRFDALMTGVRWDENPARSGEVFVSRRDRPLHFRVHPILPFTERDVWDYVLVNRLPIHPLYYKGYRSLDGKFDTVRTGEKPAWEQDLEGTRERAGRAQDKEGMMEKLRRFGYM